MTIGVNIDMYLIINKYINSGTKKVKSEDEPKKATKSVFLFFKDKKEELVAANPGIHIFELQKKSKAMWQALSAEVYICMYMIYMCIYIFICVYTYVYIYTILECMFLNYKKSLRLCGKHSLLRYIYV
jgi:hypothetical protein